MNTLFRRMGTRLESRPTVKASRRVDRALTHWVKRGAVPRRKKIASRRQYPRPGGRTSAGGPTLQTLSVLFRLCRVRVNKSGGLEDVAEFSVSDAVGNTIARNRGGYRPARAAGLGQMPLETFANA